MTGSWRAYLGEATGAHHLARGLPHEDACALWPASGASEDSTLIVAVADGHGHARHFRSDRGARIAVSIATTIGNTYALLAAGEVTAASVETILRTRFGPELLTAWRTAVAADLSADPVGAAEAAAAGLSSPPTADELVFGYGATLLVAVVAGRWLLCLQIGDGDFLLVNSDGTVDRPIPGDPQLDGLRTTSLCQSDALDNMRYGVRATNEDIGAILLASDGYGNAQARDDWEAVFGTELAALVIANGTESVGRALPAWAQRCASTEGSGDDATIAMAFAPDADWRASSAGAATTRVMQAVRDVPEVTVPDTPAEPSAGEPTIPLVTRSRRPRMPEAPPTVQLPAVRAPASTPLPVHRHDRFSGGRHAGPNRRALLTAVTVLVIGTIAAAVIVLWFS